MNASTIISLLENPGALNKNEQVEIDKLLKRYPYFVAPRFIRTRHLRETGSLDLKAEIKKTAVASIDRKKLYEYLYRESVLRKINEEFENVKVTEANSEEADLTDNDSSYQKEVSFVDLAKNTGTDPLERLIVGSAIEQGFTEEIEKTYYSPAIPEKPRKTSPMHGKQSFSDWLKMLDEKQMKNWRANESSSREKTLSESDIIDNFLKNDVSHIDINREPSTFTPENMARLNTLDEDGFVTETLANIYAKQGNIAKAIESYKKLMLNYPEKKTYFAARIKKLKNIQ